MGTIIGAQLDNYRIVEKLGEGGMGAVYRAVDVMLERDVALKFLRPELSREPELVERFRAEAILLARLNHHFIAPIFGLHRYAEEFFIAMEYVPGETLDARLKRIERFSPDAALHITSMILQALDYAHQRGVVHRDIKPGNVILTPSGTVKVMDFGIARVLGAERRTRAGAIVGTIAYMAPEQIQGQDADQRADLYSVGTLLYEMLSGHVPFKADTDWAMMQAQIGQPPLPLRGEVEVAEALEKAVLKALEKAPERRYQNAPEFQQALEALARAQDDSIYTVVQGTRPPVSGATPPTDGRGVAHWEETRLGIPTPLPGATVSSHGLGVPSPPVTPPRSSAGTPQPAPADLTRLASPSPASAARSSGLVPPPLPPLPAVPSTHAPIPAPAGESFRSQVTPLMGQAPAVSVPGRATATPRQKGGPKKNATLGLILGAVGLVGVAATGWVVLQRGQGQPPTAELPAETPAAVPEPSSNAVPNAGAANAPTPTPPTVPVPSASSTPAPTTAAPSGATVTPGTTASRPRTPSPTDTAALEASRAPATVPAPAPPVATVPSPMSTPAAPMERPATARPDFPAAATVPTTVEVFKEIRIVRNNGLEVEGEMHFGPAQLEVTNVGGRNRFHAFDYKDITSAEYQESRHSRVFVRTTRYWLLLHGLAGWELRLRLDRDSAKPIISALEQRWGHKVVTTTPADQDK